RDHTVAHPLHVYFDLSPHGKAVQALLGSNIPQAWFHTGAPRARERPRGGPVSLGYHLLRQGRGGWRDKDCQMFATRRGMLSALFSPRTRLAVHCVCCISAVAVVPNLVPTGFQLSACVVWTPIARMLLGVGTLF